MLPLLPTMGCSSSLAMSRRGEDVTEMAEWEEEVIIMVGEVGGANSEVAETVEISITHSSSERWCCCCC